MTKFLFTTVAVAALMSAPAIAADIPMKAGPAPAVFNWTGFYFGAHAGYGWNGVRSVLFDDGDPTEGIGTKRWSGLVYGAQLGYNTQINNLVFGIEADWSGGIGSATKGFFDAGDTNPDSSATKITDLASVRGRLGILLAPNSLLYGTAGWGWGRGRSTSIDGDGPTVQVISHVSDSGAVFGGGWEYMLSPISTVRIEYLHYAFSKTNSGFIPPDTPFFNTLRGMDVVRLGVNFKFGDPWGKSPVVARY